MCCGKKTHTLFVVSIVICVVMTYKHSGMAILEKSMCLVNHSMCIDKHFNILLRRCSEFQQNQCT